MISARRRTELAARVRHTTMIVAICGGMFFFFDADAESGDPADILPPGIGRELVLSTCSACHSIRLVAQQRLSRETWDETLDWMISEQGMPRLGTRDRQLILRYLSTHLNSSVPR